MLFYLAAFTMRLVLPLVIFILWLELPLSVVQCDVFLSCRFHLALCAAAYNNTV